MTKNINSVYIIKTAMWLFSKVRCMIPDKYFYLEAKAPWTGNVYNRLVVYMGLHPWNQPMADQNYSE